MFKPRYIISALLTIVVGLSLVMTYFILYDNESFQSLVSVQEEDVTNMINNEQARDTITNYMQPTDLSFQDVIAPSELIVRLGQQSYYVHGVSIFSTIRSLVESRPFVVDNVQVLDDPGTYNYLFDVDHLQIVLPERLPFGLYTRMLSIEEGLATDVFIDRIIIPFVSQDNNDVFLVDSENETYIIGQLSTNLTSEDFRTVILRTDARMTDVLRYNGANGPIYLPVNNVTMSSKLYTLDSNLENLYVRNIFTDNNFTPSEVREGLFRFQNYQYTLEVNRDQQRFSLSINRVGQGEPRTLNEKLRNSYSYVQDYEYWNGNLRLTSFDNNIVTYRRFHEGFPILTSSSTVDYGANIVQMRSDLSGDVYRYHQPMLVFYAYIDNISEDYELASHEEIIELLQFENYTVSAFDDIFIGYEWQEDMENFKKAELIPTWFFNLNGQYYTIDDIQTNDFREDWEAYQNFLLNMTNNSGGDE